MTVEGVDWRGQQGLNGLPIHRVVQKVGFLSSRPLLVTNHVENVNTFNALLFH